MWYAWLATHAGDVPVWLGVGVGVLVGGAVVGGGVVGGAVPHVPLSVHSAYCAWWVAGSAPCDQ